jgi:hypothetical protein
MNRGDRREAIFLDEGDRESFLEALTEACGKTSWQVASPEILAPGASVSRR